MDLNKFLPYQLSVLSNKISTGIAKYYREQHGISIAQWRVLALLSDKCNQTAKDLTIKSQMDKVRVSRTMKSLEDRNFISQQACDKDKRARRYKLTKEGIALINQVKPKAIAFEKRLLETLNPQQTKQLQSCIKALNSQVDKITEEI